jgi:hypothetical protein
LLQLLLEEEFVCCLLEDDLYEVLFEGVVEGQMSLDFLMMNIQQLV